VVTDVEQLRRLSRSRPPAVPGRRVRLEVPELDARDRARWEARLSRWAGSCGCKSGAAFLLAWVLLWAAAVVTGRLGLSMTTPVVFAAGCLLASLVGKVLGLVVGRVALRLSVWRLIRTMGRADGAPGTGRPTV